MPTVDLPSGVRCFAEEWELVGGSRSGGRTLDGPEQFSTMPNHRWKAKMSFHCRKPADYAEVDGFFASLDGSANTFLIGPVDERGKPWPVDPLTGGLLTPTKLRRARGVSSAYGTNPDTTDLIKVNLAVNAPVNQTVLSVTRATGGTLRRGNYFSVGQELKIITSVATADDGANPKTLSVNVRPWLRNAYNAPAVLNFSTPTGLFRLSPQSVRSLPRVATPISDYTLDIEEAV